MKEFDVLVIGAGPGGYVAAIRAAQLGAKVGIVEREHLGGICLNWGCIPTKALLKSAEVYSYCQKAADYGVKVSKVEFDLEALVKRSRTVAGKLVKGIEFLMKKNKVEVIMGEAKLERDKLVTVGTTKIKAKNIILSTGARPRVLNGLEPDQNLVWDYKSAMVPKTMPKSLLVIGSGAIGIEFASFYNTLGVAVTVVEIADRILQAEDVEVSAFAAKSFVKKGMNIYTKTTATIKAKGKDNVKVALDNGTKTWEEIFDRVIVAVGISPNVENLGLEHFPAIRKDKGGSIETNEFGLTGAPGIYAIGDICKGPWLAHKASHEGVVAAEHIMGKKTHGIKREMIPGCTYSDPQVASIGLTEARAKEAGHTVKVGNFAFSANGKAIAIGKEDGFVKTIFDAKTGELLGAHLVGAEVTEMISALAVAKTLETTEEDLMATIFPHPTLSEMLHESVLSAYNRALHM